MEIYKSVVGYEQFYQVSNLGNIKSLDRIVKRGKGYFLKKGRLIEGKDNGKGYLSVALWVNGEGKYFYIHRLVLQAFIGDFKEGYETNHINGIKSDNKLENLEFVTKSENQIHAINILGKKPGKPYLGKFGFEHNKSIGVSQFNLEGVKIQEYGSIKEAERITGIKRQQIGGCCRGKKKYRTAGGFVWKYL